MPFARRPGRRQQTGQQQAQQQQQAQPPPPQAQQQQQRRRRSLRRRSRDLARAVYSTVSGGGGGGVPARRAVDNSRRGPSASFRDDFTWPDAGDGLPSIVVIVPFERLSEAQKAAREETHNSIEVYPRELTGNPKFMSRFDGCFANEIPDAHVVYRKHPARNMYLKFDEFERKISEEMILEQMFLLEDGGAKSIILNEDLFNEVKQRREFSGHFAVDVPAASAVTAVTAAAAAAATAASAAAADEDGASGASSGASGVVPGALGAGGSFGRDMHRTSTAKRTITSKLGKPVYFPHVRKGKARWYYHNGYLAHMDAFLREVSDGPRRDMLSLSFKVATDIVKTRSVSGNFLNVVGLGHVTSMAPKQHGDLNVEVIFFNEEDYKNAQHYDDGLARYRKSLRHSIAQLSKERQRYHNESIFVRSDMRVLLPESFFNVVAQTSREVPIETFAHEVSMLIAEYRQSIDDLARGASAKKDALNKRRKSLEKRSWRRQLTREEANELEEAGNEIARLEDAPELRRLEDLDVWELFFQTQRDAAVPVVPITLYGRNLLLADGREAVNGTDASLALQYRVIYTLSMVFHHTYDTFGTEGYTAWRTLVGHQSCNGIQFTVSDVEFGSGVCEIEDQKESDEADAAADTAADTVADSARSSPSSAIFRMQPAGDCSSATRCANGSYIPFGVQILVVDGHQALRAYQDNDHTFIRDLQPFMGPEPSSKSVMRLKDRYPPAVVLLAGEFSGRELDSGAVYKEACKWVQAELVMEQRVHWFPLLMPPRAAQSATDNSGPAISLEDWVDNGDYVLFTLTTIIDQITAKEGEVWAAVVKTS